MTQAAPEITESYSPETLTDRELLTEIMARLIRMEGEINRLLGAWSLGGLRGLRQAARSNSG